MAILLVSDFISDWSEVHSEALREVLGTGRASVPEPESSTRPQMQLGSLRGKVAQILTARDLALNIGYEHGVTSGMVFAILNAKGASIKDPDTGQELGSVSLPKVFVKASVVDQNGYTKQCYTNLYKSAPGRNRTCCLSVRSRTLCPVSYRRDRSSPV